MIWIINKKILILAVLLFLIPVSVTLTYGDLSSPTYINNFQLDLSFGQPHYPYMYQIAGIWYNGTGDQTPINIYANVTPTYPPYADISYLHYEVYKSSNYGNWVFQYALDVYDNDINDQNSQINHIQAMEYMSESAWYEIRYWCYDTQGNRYPPEAPYLLEDFIVDATNPESDSYFIGPYYDDSFIWITNQTKKIIDATDYGGITGGIGVHYIDWSVDKKEGNQWNRVQSGIVFDNDFNDTDGTPAQPSNGNVGGLYSFGQFGRPFTFQDTNENWKFDKDSESNNINYDPDGDGLIAYPQNGSDGGLFCLDSHLEPYIYIENNNTEDWTYNNNENVIHFDADNDGIPANPEIGQMGGLYAFNGSQPYTFKDTGNSKWAYDSNDQNVSLKPDVDGYGTIQMAIQIEQDGEYLINYQLKDRFDNQEQIQSQYVRVDNTPPHTQLYVAQPSDYLSKYPAYTITTQTLLTLTAEDNPIPYAAGIDYIHYEVINNDTQETLFSKNEYTWNDVTFNITQEGTYTLQYYSVDLLENIEIVHNMTFFVDNQPPEFNITIGEPAHNSTGEPDYWITKNTPITIDVINHGASPSLDVKYRINQGPWEPLALMHNYDDFSQLPHTLYFEDEIRYELEIFASDYVNIAEKTLVFYVDNTAPNLTILQPVSGGWYTIGSLIPAVVFAEDIPSPTSQVGSVGITEGHHGDAYLIDVFPSFTITQLNCSQFIYNTSAHEFIGQILIENLTGIENGEVLFVAGASDTLHNGATTLLDELYDYFIIANGDEDLFDILIADLLNQQNLVHIGIDKTPPTVQITTPNFGQEIGPFTVDISAQMTDALSGLQAGTVCSFSLSFVDIGTLPYNPDIGGCAGRVSIPDTVPGGADLPLTITVHDRAGNNGHHTILVNYTSLGEPRVSFVKPAENSIQENSMTIEISAIDSKTPTEELSVTINIIRQADPPLLYTAFYDPQTNHFIVTIDVSEYQNGSQLQIQAFATDEDQLTGASQPRMVSIHSTIYYDKWMRQGWNQINLGMLNGKKDLQKVFSSINESYTIIFEVGTGRNYIAGEKGNTLTQIDPTAWYWVQMTTPDRFYLDSTNPIT